MTDNLFFPHYQENGSTFENNYSVKLVPEILENLIHGKFPPRKFLPLNIVKRNSNMGRIIYIFA